MDAFTFISELIKGVAWPVTAIVLVVLLCKPVVELIPFKIQGVRTGVYSRGF